MKWRPRLLGRVAVVVLTMVSLVVSVRLELSKDLTSLFPHTPEASMLARVTRAFGGGDVALVLVRSDNAETTTKAAEMAVEALRKLPSVVAVVDAAPPPPPIDASEAWRFAGPRARRRLAETLTEDGMRARLRETRSLLLAPGASDVADLIVKDPLRLSMIPFEDRIEVAAGARGLAGGAFVADEGRARLVIVEPRGRAFDPGAAARFTNEANDALAGARKLARVELTGGHVVATQTEAMMRSDLTKSGILSIVLSAIVFVVTFRRPRALLAVMPPLLAGTLWTTALAAILYPRLSAVATAFAAVVIGVGVDTGVHVYGRLLAARRDGHPPDRAATIAFQETWKPTLGAAVAAAGAFACLLLSDVEGMKQLGVLCAAGEVLTAVAILLVVPEIGAWLERGKPPAAPRAQWVADLTRSRTRAVVAVVLTMVAFVVALASGWPRFDHAIVALDARTLPALATYAAIDETFGTSRGQLVVVSTDADEAKARARSDAIAEAVEGKVDGFDALARLAPSSALQAARLEARDRLDLPAKAPVLSRLLAEEGFSTEAFAPAIDAFLHPSTNTADIVTGDVSPALAWLRRRYLATDDQGSLSVVYIRGKPEAALLRGADPSCVITGFSALERGLVETLAHDLPRVLGASFAMVTFVLAVSLRRASRVAIAAVVLAVEIAIVLALARLCGVRWHIYDALVLPVLLGITLDEVLFLLEAAERFGSIDEAITEQAPLGTATALTTAVGFGALVVCRFDGLADVGKVGALGSTVGLLVALVLIPAVYRLLPSVRPAR